MSGERANRLFVVLATFFVANALLAEFIGVKIFALEDTLGIAPLQWNLFGQTGSLNFTAGTLLWPVVFVMTDVVNEFYGRRGVRFISWLAAVLIVYGFVFAYVAIGLAPASWWVGVAVDQGVPDYQRAFAAHGTPGRSNGIVSGLTAPPEMMKLIASSTVQSVGVSRSTGTTSR